MSKTVLVVDDQPMLRDLISAVLCRRGIAFEMASSGPQAIDVFKTNPDQFAAILLDVNMPILDGVYTFAKLRDIQPAIPIVLMTGRSERYDEETLEMLGANSIIFKPFKPAELVSVLEEHVLHPH